MGAMIVRIPVHPIACRDRTPEGYLKLLDEAVQWCTELKMYVIIAWHSIGNLETEIFQNPMYNTTLSHLRYEPINAEGIAYVTHPYPMKKRTHGK